MKKDIYIYIYNIYLFIYEYNSIVSVSYYHSHFGIVRFEVLDWIFHFSPDGNETPSASTPHTQTNNTDTSQTPRVTTSNTGNEGATGNPHPLVARQQQSPPTDGEGAALSGLRNAVASVNMLSEEMTSKRSELQSLQKQLGDMKKLLEVTTAARQEVSSLYPCS